MYVFFFKPHLPFLMPSFPISLGVGKGDWFSTHLLCQFLPQTFNLSSIVVIWKRKENCKQSSLSVDLLCWDLASPHTEERSKPTRLTFCTKIHFRYTMLRAWENKRDLLSKSQSGKQLWNEIREEETTACYRCTLYSDTLLIFIQVLRVPPYFSENSFPVFSLLHCNLVAEPLANDCCVRSPPL